MQDSHSTLTYENLKQILGADDLDLLKLGIKTTKKGTISKGRYAIPLYHDVTAIARENFLRPTPESCFEVKVNGTTKYISPIAQVKYCITMGLPAFSPECVEDIENETCRPVSITDSKINCRGLEISYKGDYITNVNLS